MKPVSQLPKLYLLNFKNLIFFYKKAYALIVSFTVYLVLRMYFFFPTHSFFSLEVIVSVYLCLFYLKGFPGGWAPKEFTCNVGDLGSIPGLGTSPGEGNSYPLQYSGPGEFHGLYSPWSCKESDKELPKYLRCLVNSHTLLCGKN